MNYPTISYAHSQQQVVSKFLWLHLTSASAFINNSHSDVEGLFSVVCNHSSAQCHIWNVYAYDHTIGAAMTSQRHPKRILQMGDTTLAAGLRFSLHKGTLPCRSQRAQPITHIPPREFFRIKHFVLIFNILTSFPFCPEEAFSCYRLLFHSSDFGFLQRQRQFQISPRK